jgi:hypothetical protein
MLLVKKGAWNGSLSFNGYQIAHVAYDWYVHLTRKVDMYCKGGDSTDHRRSDVLGIIYQIS